jgi:hypothetical protein
MKLSKYSVGVGDRFGRQGNAQLQAILQAQAAGIDVVPVWNKSCREHTIIGTHPKDVREEADAAVKKAGYQGAYHVDADHINLSNVDDFIAHSDFFTIDVAESIGQPCDAAVQKAFIERCTPYIGTLTLPGIDETFTVTREDLEAISTKFLGAVQEAGNIYRHIAEAKGAAPFITEVSMDETDEPQTPIEMFFILAAIAQEGIPAQTIAPRFSGRFNKGVNYVGDPVQFGKEFREDVAVIALATKEFDLPANLKLSVHSGSDKFAIYGPISKVLQEFNAGVHLKTAGTTWLEELIGLAEAGGEGLAMAKEVYSQAYAQSDALCAPYASVIDIDTSQLPAPDVVQGWDSDTYVKSLRHDLSCDLYNPNLRQLLHVGYKVAAKMGDTYLQALQDHEAVISRNVTTNILDRHIKPLLGS